MRSLVIGASVVGALVLGAAGAPASAALSTPAATTALSTPAARAAGLSSPMAAAVPVPTPSVDLPAQLDRAAFYEPQTVCNPVAQPGALALRDLLVDTYGRATVYIPRACTSSTSEHFDGRAVDWMHSVRVPAEKREAEAFVNWLLAPAADGTPQEMARRLGVMYIIWNNRMIRMYDVGRGWTNYRSCQSSANSGTGMDTTCHRNHVHLSLSWDGAAGITSWWTGRAMTQPYCSARTTSAKPGSGSASVVTDLAGVGGLVRVTATTILDTAAGSGGGLSSSCRLQAGRSVFPKAAVANVVPAGADWAAVSVTSTSNAPASLVAWSSGATKPKGLASTPIGTTTRTVLVPIASDGTIGLATTQGAANLRAQVVGYIAGEPSLGAPKPAALTIPSKPRSVTATSKKRSVTTKWKAPTSNGGSAIVGYRVEALVSAKKGAKVAGVCTTNAKGRSCTIKRLTKGKKYWMSVSVRNGVGSTWAARKAVKVR